MGAGDTGDKPDPKPADGAKPEDGKPTTPPPGTGEPDPFEGLGEAGKRALKAERDARQAAEKAAETARNEAEALRKKHQSAEERALEEAKNAGRAEALAEANSRLVRAEVRTAAAGKLTDPGDAGALLGDLDRFVVKGEVDTKAIASAIDELVKAKPYLAAAGSKPKALPGGGQEQRGGNSFSDTLRGRIAARNGRG